MKDKKGILIEILHLNSSFKCGSHIAVCDLRAHKCTKSHTHTGARRAEMENEKVQVRKHNLVLSAVMFSTII